MPKDAVSHTKKVTLQRAFSKLGISSRTQAEQLVKEGRVQINGRLATNPSVWVDIDSDRLTLDGKLLEGRHQVYLALNKPRGLVTTRHDPEGRPTVFDCLRSVDLPFVAPVGRLDKASEGLLLFTNDTVLAQRLLEPSLSIRKTYHVQVNGMPTEHALRRLANGVACGGAHLAAKSVRVIRRGEKNCWLEVELTEGKNRQIRRMMEEVDLLCLRLVRVAIHDLVLGDLPKGHHRHLTEFEIQSLRAGAGLP
ncbi:rRNA pseudouridine synthase [Neorhizobium sp. T786]|uniref:pseudouridine synthase n=1 Tax=Pseudorhizobium xiangyangii TaxID=2883104 RepID=UPI001CFFE88B|nr:pseudouridine synthase [Neorhizobium xiangyangii]MCB5204922.1 rRNA pseudouridine synthase [Neorhizobium xiangyangii]